jgi:hypothetical protein
MKNNRSDCQAYNFGTAAIYAARSYSWKHYEGDYEIKLGSKSYPKEMRAYLQGAKTRGKECMRREEALRGEAVVIFGPDISAEEAISLLRRLANEIAKRGLYVGEIRSGQELFERKVTQI